MTRWSAPVRYVEADAQGVVFNSHYLVWCDEAMSAFCRDRGLGDLGADVQLVASTLTWRSAARWGDSVDVDVACVRVGTSSFGLRFVIGVDGRLCCEVDTTYVFAPNGRATPLTDEMRAALP